MLIPRPALPTFLARLEDRLAKSGPEAVLRTLGQHVQLFPENVPLPADQQALLSQVLEAIRRIVDEHGQSDEAFVIELMTLGKLGRSDEAVRRARGAFEERPTWASAIAAGNAHRRAGDVKAAVEMFTAAAGLDQHDETALLEVGDLELEAGRLSEALAAYEAALGRAEGHSWAEPSAWYCRHLLTGQPQWRELLHEAASQPPDECGVADALSGLFGEYSDEQRRSRAEYLLEKLKQQG